MFDLALKIATDAHRGQFDKAGAPYINHPIAVANLVKNDDARIVALLHDVLEDTNITVNNLIHYGFNKTIIDAIVILTRKIDEDYEQYLERVKSNSIALEVKIADLTHNSDTTRIPSPTEEDYECVKKYKYYLNKIA